MNKTGRYFLHAASLLFAGNIVTACASYYFVAPAKGEFVDSKRSILAVVTYSSEKRDSGALRIGSAQKLECDGTFDIVNKGSSVSGFFQRDSVFKGKLSCLDGKTGEFEFVSMSPKAIGNSGTILGQVGNEQFKVEVIDPSAYCADKSMSCKLAPWTGYAWGQRRYMNY